MSEDLQTLRVDEDVLLAVRGVPVGWDTTEVGAPYLSFEESVPDAALALVELLIQQGRLAEGKYSYTKPEKVDTSFYVDGLPETSAFDFTSRHRALLEAMSLEMSDVDSCDEEVPGVDPKRPYGAFTYYQLEMAQHLELIPEGYKSGERLPERLEETLTDLHHQMQPALQVYLREALLEAGTYQKSFLGVWTRTA